MILKDIKSFRALMKSNQNRALLGIDFGTKTIGLSVSSNPFFARGVGSIIRDPPRRSSKSIVKLSGQLQSIINQYKVCGVIAGFPLSVDGECTPFCHEIIDLCKRINCVDMSSNIPMLCTFWDERSSTFMARGIIRNYSTKLSVVKKYKDSVAASVILQNYLESDLH